MLEAWIQPFSTAHKKVKRLLFFNLLLECLGTGKKQDTIYRCSPTSFTKKLKIPVFLLHLAVNF